MLWIQGECPVDSRIASYSGRVLFVYNNTSLENRTRNKNKRAVFIEEGDLCQAYLLAVLVLELDRHLVDVPGARGGHARRPL